MSDKNLNNAQNIAQNAFEQGQAGADAAKQIISDAPTGNAAVDLGKKAFNTLSKAGKSVDRAFDPDAEQDNNAIGCATGCLGGLLAGIGILLAPFVIVAGIFITAGSFLFSFFSRILGFDAGKFEGSIAQQSMIYKNANAKGMSIKDVVKVDSKTTYLITVDGEIQSKYDDFLPEDAEELKDSPNLGKSVPVYSTASSAGKKVGAFDHGDVVQALDSKAWVGDFLKIYIKSDKESELVKSGDVDVIDKDTRDYDDDEISTIMETLKEDEVFYVGYVHKNNVFKEEVNDPNHEYTVEDEYKILGTSIKFTISEKYAESRAEVSSRINSYLNNSSYNKYLIDKREAEVKDSTVYVEGGDDNKFNPNDPEFNATKSLKAVNDNARSGQIVTQEAAEILASYSIAKREVPPEEGFFSDLDKNFSKHMAGQFAASQGTMRSVDKKRKVPTSQIEEKEGLINEYKKGRMVHVDDLIEDDMDKEEVEEILAKANYSKSYAGSYDKEKTYDWDEIPTPAVGYVDVGAGNGRFILQKGSGSTLIKTPGTYKKLTKPKDKTYTYKEYYLDGVTIPPFDVDALVRDIFLTAGDDYDDIKATSDSDKFNAIMKHDYYPKEWHYVYDNPKDKDELAELAEEFEVDACDETGTDVTSNCGVEAKVKKKWFFFTVGYEQKLVQAKEPEYKQYMDHESDPVENADGEGYEKEGVDQVPFTVREKIDFTVQNMVEMLDDEVFNSRNSTGRGGRAIVEVARGEDGNVGGKKFQMWYYNTASISGIPSTDAGPNQVHWCAIFVSWAADQIGLIDGGIVPKSAGVVNYVDWYKNPANPGSYHNKNGYTPEIGDFVIYDFGGFNSMSHIEIVSEINGNMFSAIGGNTAGHGINDSPPGVVAEHVDYMTTTDDYVNSFLSPDYPAEGGLEEVITDVVRKSIDDKPTIKREGFGILEWKNDAVLNIHNQIRDKNKNSYNEIVKNYSKKDIEVMERAIKNGAPNSITSSEPAYEMINKIWGSTDGKRVQDERSARIVESNMKSIENMSGGSKLKGKALAYITDVAVEFEVNGKSVINNANFLKAVSNVAQQGGSLETAHAVFSKAKLPNKVSYYDTARRSTFARLNAMSDEDFMMEVDATGKADGEYLNGVGADAYLCKMDSRAERMKTFMSWRAITNTSSKQYHFQHDTIQGHRAITDPRTGIRMFNGRYMVAVPPTYGTVGTRLDVTIGGKVVKVVVGDTKAEGATCQHHDGSWIEFIVEQPSISNSVAVSGSFNSLNQFSGPIERIVYQGTISVPSSW